MTRLSVTGAGSVLLFAAALAGAGCGAATPNYDALPAHERDLYDRCYDHVHVEECEVEAVNWGALGAAESRRCVDRTRERWAELHPEDRRRWLIKHGCPPWIVRPEQH